MNFPYIYQCYSIREIMFFVLIACIPGIFAKCYFFGFSVLIQILFSIIIALFLEIVVLKIRGKNIKINLYDNSAIVTAVLFSIGLPSFLPWWVMCIGLFFSVVIAKHLYGGIGQNIFNPAMIGYAVLLISFPLYMSNWIENYSSFLSLEEIKKSFMFIFSKNSVYDHKIQEFPDFFSQATPLDNFKTYTHWHCNAILQNFLPSNINISIQNSWTWMNLSFLLGGLFLLYKKIIYWRIPFSFLSTLILFTSITWSIDHDCFSSPIVNLFSGGTMICAFFIATDPVTTACTNSGQIIFGMMIGFLVWVIRHYSDYPDSIAFAVLFSNMIVPLIDRFVQSSGYGHTKI